MRKQKLLFKAATLLLALIFAQAGVPFAGTASSSYSKRETGLYRDVFDQSLYYEGTEPLHLERLSRGLWGTRKRAQNVNAFDEVPDSTFFTNRHGRESLSEGALKQGPATEGGPDPGGDWSITKGKFEGLTPGFFIRDSRGGRYLLKFDPIDNLELNTGAEAVASRFYHALGYQVPSYTLVSFKKEKLVIDPQATIYDESGFQKKLTPEGLDEFLLFIPETEDGRYRASASRILEGEILGPMKFQGRRRDDPEDTVNHEDRREIRALQVFASWLNNNDMRESNSLDVVQERDGQRRIWHYLIDFGSSLGAASGGPKPPMFGHELMLDYGETLKAIFSFGFWKKPWQKRWDEAGREVQSPGTGYFDNRHFHPARFRTQLPYFPFKDLTRSDGFWAAKILMRFTDDDIKALVSTGEFSAKKAEEALAGTLIERRDLIGRYWFKQANPLDEFRLFKEGGAYELRFEDLAVRHGFVPETGNAYRIEVIAGKGKRRIRVAQEDIQEQTVRINPDWLTRYPSLDLLIRTRRPNAVTWGPFVRVRIESQTGVPRLAGILHQD